MTSAFRILAQGVGLGLAVAVPVGPISILCMKRSISKGLLSGIMSALGSSTGDALYALIVAIGASVFVINLTNHPLLINSICGTTLLILGVIIFLDSSQSSGRLFKKTAQSNSQPALFKDYLSLFLINMMNPMTILPFAAVLAGFQEISRFSNFFYLSLFIVGVFGSGLVWRLLLCLFAHEIGSTFTAWHHRMINRIIGAMIAIFGGSTLLATGGWIRL